MPTAKQNMTDEELRQARIQEQIDEWENRLKDHENEFTTEEVMKKITDPEVNTRDMDAFRQRMAFEHRKAETDPAECPGFFITKNGNLRRDY